MQKLLPILVYKSHNALFGIHLVKQGLFLIQNKFCHTFGHLLAEFLCSGIGRYLTNRTRHNQVDICVTCKLCLVPTVQREILKCIIGTSLRDYLKNVSFFKCTIPLVPLYILYICCSDGRNDFVVLWVSVSTFSFQCPFQKFVLRVNFSQSSILNNVSTF